MKNIKYKIKEQKIYIVYKNQSEKMIRKLATFLL